MPDYEKKTGEVVTDFASVDQTGDPGFFLKFLDTVNTLPDARAWKPVIAEGLRVQPGDSVLDVGCGAGWGAFELARAVGAGGRVTGVDTSLTLIEEAKRRADRVALPPTFETGDAQSLAFPDHHFDAVRAERLLMHVADPERALAEMVRVLRPGGRIAVQDFDWETQICDSPERATTRTIALSFCDGLQHGWIGRRLPRLFRQAGLGEVSTTFQIVTIPFSFLTMLLGGHVASIVSKRVLSAEDADRWWTDLARADRDGSFFYAFTAVIVSGLKSESF